LGSDAVRIETRQLDKFDIKNNTVRTQAGASVPEIIRAAAEKGFVFPFQPASACRKEDSYNYLGVKVGPVTIGGSLGANASGLVGCKLGAALDWVTEMTLVTPDGEIKTVTEGFDKYVGKEGLYGLIFGAVIKLAPQPENILTYLIGGHSVEKFTETATAIGNSGVLPLLAETMIMGKEPHDFHALAEKLFSDPETFLDKFSSYLGAEGWLILLQGQSDEVDACLHALDNLTASPDCIKLSDEEFDQLKQIRAAASDEISRGIENPNINSDDEDPIKRAAKFLNESISEFRKLGVRPKAEHNMGLLRIFLLSDEERETLKKNIEDKKAFDDGSLALYEKYSTDFTGFLEDHLSPIVTEEMVKEKMAVNFPGNEDLLIPAERFPETIDLLGKLMQKYNACAVPLYYCHINFRKQPGWILLHNRLLIDVAEFV
ncbi:MAG: FAD-binding oxidoreductase, partial [Planctomycetota bacterium]